MKNLKEYSHDEFEQLHIEENMMYEPPRLPKDSLHDLYLWHKEQREKEAERKRKTEM